MFFAKTGVRRFRADAARIRAHDQPREARTAQLQVLRPDTQLRGRGVHYMRVVQPRAGQLIWSRPDPAATDECIAPRHSLRGARSMTFHGSARSWENVRVTMQWRSERGLRCVAQ